MLADQPCFLTGRCCWPMSLIRCGGPSAIRKRTAAKRAFSLPLVPSRQLTFFHLASASSLPPVSTSDPGCAADEGDPARRSERSASPPPDKLSDAQRSRLP